jgi:hypothetical protein
MVIAGVRTIEKVIRKAPDEILRREIDLSDDMATAEVISAESSGNRVITPTGELTITSVTFSGQLLVITLSGGAVLKTYHVSIRLDTDLGQKLRVAIVVPVRAE